MESGWVAGCVVDHNPMPRRLGFIGQFGDSGPITVEATGDTSWRVVLYSGV